MQGLELLEYRPHGRTQLDLGEENGDRPIAIDEEFGALSAGPVVSAPLWSRHLHAHAKSPTHLCPEAREEAIRVLYSANTWSLVI